MQNQIISIITASYNCGKYIHRLLDSVLMQTYPAIEMFVVDDGSIDDTQSIIERYIPLFENKGYSLSYHYQENQGQSVAVNNALKMIKGEYLVWPDADDFYKTKDALEILASPLKNSLDDVGMSRCFLEYLNEDDLRVVRTIKSDHPFSESLFEDCLFGTQGFWYCSGGYMVKTGVLRETIPDLEIYTEHDAGQNWQLMLPVLYEHKCITVPSVNYSVLMRNSSHSRGQYSTRTQVNKQLNGYRNTILSTLERIPSMPREQLRSYSNRINRKYNRLVLENNIRQYSRPFRQLIKKLLNRKHD